MEEAQKRAYNSKTFCVPISYKVDVILFNIAIIEAIGNVDFCKTTLTTERRPNNAYTCYLKTRSLKKNDSQRERRPTTSKLKPIKTNTH